MCKIELNWTQISDFAPASSKEFLDIQATIEWGFTLKRVRDMIRTYNQVLNIRKQSIRKILTYENEVKHQIERYLKNPEKQIEYKKDCTKNIQHYS